MVDAELRTLVPRRKFDFAGLANNGVLELSIAKNIWVDRWALGVLLVRQHAAGLAASASVNVTVLACLPSLEDPDLDFTLATSLATLSLAPPSPALLTASLALDDVGALTILLKAARVTNPGPIDVTLSIDLVLRSA